jgi:hypothetical protein
MYVGICLKCWEEFREALVSKSEDQMITVSNQLGCYFQKLEIDTYM